ncbi:MAG: hypothetical protein O3A78_10180, partial [Nitrospinae bacterium]|nr:hypothetical protein [Nitrospinota bacterium]
REPQSGVAIQDSGLLHFVRNDGLRKGLLTKGRLGGVVSPPRCRERKESLEEKSLSPPEGRG